MQNEVIEIELWSDDWIDVDEDILYLFTDWSSRPLWNEKLKRKTWRHWWKWVWLVYIGKKWKIYWEDISDFVSYDKATNNDMELNAVIDWLSYILKFWWLDKFKKIKIMTDSMFLVDNRKKSLYRWQANWWKTMQWNRVVHTPERKQFSKLFSKISKSWWRIEFFWVKWHEWTFFNEKADESAKEWTRSKTRVKDSWGKGERYFFLEKVWFDEKLPIFWEKNILIHSTNYRRLYKWQYRYEIEIVSPESKYFWYRTYVYTENVMSAELIYEVDIKNDNSYQIERMIAEYEKEEIIKKILNYWMSEDVFYKSKNWKKKK